MNDKVYKILDKKARQYGLPLNVWWPVVMFESSGNPLAIGDGGKSYGLFQINTSVHHSYNINKGIQSIEYQADYWMPNLVTAYKQGKSKGLTGLDLTLYVERYGERPKWGQNVIDGITKYYNQITSGNEESKEDDPGVVDYVTDPVGSIKTTLINTFDNLLDNIIKVGGTLGVYTVLIMVIVVSVMIVYAQEPLKQGIKTGIKAGKAYATSGASLAGDL
jgi:hypothetical protein